MLFSSDGMAHADETQLDGAVEVGGARLLQLTGVGRDGFSHAAAHPVHEQVLAPERLVAISDVALLFVRVVDAIRRYEREEAEVHRELLSLSVQVHDAASLEGGALVKLQGDGVMAVFSDRVAAARAALRLVREGGPAMALHAGAARMTSIGGQLDYFGKTLHVAEHLSRWANAGELLVSEVLLSDGAIVTLLTAPLELSGYARVGDVLASRLGARPIGRTGSTVAP